MDPGARAKEGIVDPEEGKRKGASHDVVDLSYPYCFLFLRDEQGRQWNRLGLTDGQVVNGGAAAGQLAILYSYERL